MFRDDLQTKIKEFAITKGSLTIPELQVEFNLAYKDVAPVVKKLCDEGFISLESGLKYVVCSAPPGFLRRPGYAESNYENARRILLRRLKSSMDTDELFDEDRDDGRHENQLRSNFNETGFNDPIEEAFLVKVLAFCIQKNEISLSSVAFRFRCGFIMANRAIDKMLAEGYITPARRGDRTVYITDITKEQCQEKYGSKYPDLFGNKESGEELLIKLNKRLSERKRIKPKNGQLLSKKVEKKMSKSYISLFTAKFNMQTAVRRVPEIDKKAEDIITRAQSDLSLYGGEWNSSKAFESICMDVLEKIVGMNGQWRRMDAAYEAAKELIAADYTKQSRDALSIHSRVLYELLDGKDEDYERIKKQIWG